MRKGKQNWTKTTLSEAELGSLEKTAGIIMGLLLVPVGSASMTVSTVFNTMYN